MPADLTAMNFDELEEQLHHHDSIEAGDEMLRRLRGVVPMLDEIRNVSAAPHRVQFVAEQATELVTGERDDAR